ncbi:MAG: EAL domain-containing protein [Burkholderiales bacterium]|nr:EAL domain-containing protein [Burkholderiales bacterium]
MTSMLRLDDLIRVLDRSSAMCACFEMDGRLSYCTLAYAKHAGIAREQLLGMHYLDFVAPDSIASIVASRPLIERGEPATYKREFVAEDGQPRAVEIVVRPLQLTDRQVLVSSVIDISTHHQAAITQAQSLLRMQKFFEATHEGILFHVDGRIQDVNPSLLAILGYNASEVVNHDILEFVPASERDQVRPPSGERIPASEVRETLVKAKDGREVPIEFIVRDIEWMGGEQRMVVIRDLTERKRAEQRIRHLALHDALTGLPNRAYLEHHLNDLIAKTCGTNRVFALMFIDLDHLKRINDSLGHAAGDGVLQAIAAQLSDFCADPARRAVNAWAARLGGDEFVVTCETRTRADAGAIVSSVERLFDFPIKAKAREFLVTASIGVAIYPDDGASSELLLQHADGAMYAAKAGGRDGVRYFDQAIAKAAEEALQIEHELRLALSRGEFRLHFQPELRSQDNALRSVEVLLRWQHPSRGMLSPDSFLPVAEGLRLIQPISNWVLEQSLAQMRVWQDAGLSVARISVNLSDHLIASTRAVDDLLDKIAQQGIDPARIELELTERLMMRRNPALVEDLHRLRAAGIRLAIDDFGTGLSSLSRLRSLPFDTIKIDRSFVADLPTSSSAIAVVEAIMDLARGLSVDAVAEGVENAAQLECLIGCGCQAVQGYFLAPPMPADEFERWLNMRSAGLTGAGVDAGCNDM